MVRMPRLAARAKTVALRQAWPPARPRNPWKAKRSGTGYLHRSAAHRFDRYGHMCSVRGFAPDERSQRRRPARLALQARARIVRRNPARPDQKRLPLHSTLDSVTVHRATGTYRPRSCMRGVRWRRWIDASAYSVPACALGLIEELVGSAQEIAGALHVGLPGGNSDRDGQVSSFSLDLEVVVGHRIANLLELSASIIQRGFRHQKCELLPTDSGQDAARVDVVGEDCGQLPQRAVASQMAELVIDLLEMIDIQQRKGQRLSVAAASLANLVLHHADQLSSVVETCQRVANGVFVQFKVVVGLDVARSDEFEHRAAHAHLIAVGKRCLIDANPVEHGAVGRVQVFQPVGIRVTGNSAVGARRVAFRNVEIATGITPYGDLRS